MEHVYLIMDLEHVYLLCIQKKQSQEMLLFRRWLGLPRQVKCYSFQEFLLASLSRRSVSVTICFVVCRSVCLGYIQHTCVLMQLNFILRTQCRMFLFILEMSRKTKVDFCLSADHCSSWTCSRLTVYYYFMLNLRHSRWGFPDSFKNPHIQSCQLFSSPHHVCICTSKRILSCALSILCYWTQTFTCFIE